MGRALLFFAAVVLLGTAALHAAGRPMVDEWVSALGPQQRSAVSLVWLTDSIDWAVVSVLWAIAAWRQERAWIVAGTIAAIIPLAVAIGIIRIDPSFFGGHLLIGSVALALTGLGLSWRRQATV